MNKTDKDAAIFIKQSPVHLKNRFKKIANLNDEVEFIKQVPVHPRDRLKKLSDLKDKVELIKQVPLHPRKRLERQTKKIEVRPLILHLRNRLPPNNKLKHPRNKLATKEAQIARNNASRLMTVEFDFLIKNISKKTLLFDTSKIKKEVIIDKITELLNNALNDKYYIDHPDGTNSFTLKREDGR